MSKNINLRRSTSEKPKAIWISFDMGLKADYDGLYAWLDSYGAKECCGNLAFISYTYNSDLVSEIEKDIKDHVEITKKDRIYLIFSNEEAKMKGVWLFGTRKAPAWSGYSAKEATTDDGE
jgi:hypothetical protein